MAFHTFSVDSADTLQELDRYRLCSAEELIGYLDPTPEDTVLDIGSGTGFFTRDVAPHVGELLAIDIQPGMHQYHQREGVVESVRLLAGEAASLPIASNSVTTVYSTMTYHEYATPTVFEEIKRVLMPGGTHVVVDWSANGPDEGGPSVDERFTLADAIGHHRDAGFEIGQATERYRTFVLTAINPA